MSNVAPKVAFAVGDGIGPEIMDAVLDIMKEAGADLDLQEVTVGMAAYEAGENKGISDADFQVLENCDAFLKAPLSTPQGKGYSSVNVAIRKRFDLFANIRPSVSLEPVIAPKSAAGGVDMVVVRENLEDLYAGIEFKPTPDVAIGRKVSTISESERIIRAAFEYALANNRTKVTGIAKDNIQKMTDGQHFHDVMNRIAQDYPHIEREFYIADIGIARLGARPADFDVVVTQNMYGDIGSDVVSEALGSVGLSGSANLGEKFAMFEAVHGTAPDIAGKGIANPSGLLMAAVMMLNHLGQNEVAEKIHNAWLRTLEQGYHTGDIYDADHSYERVGTSGLAYVIRKNIGKKPSTLKPVQYKDNEPLSLEMPESSKQAFNFSAVGIDVHVQHDGDWKALHEKAQKALSGVGAKVQDVRSVRGDSLLQDGVNAFGSDYYTLRLIFHDTYKLDEQEKQQVVIDVLQAFTTASVNWREVSVLTNDPVTTELNFR